MNSRVGGFAYILSLCRTPKWTFLKIWQFFLSTQLSLVFTAGSNGDLSSQHWNCGLGSLAYALGSLAPKGIIPGFYPLHVSVGLPVLLPSPLCTTPCLHASPSILVTDPLTHLDECGFIKSLVVRLPYSSIFWQFWLFVLRYSCLSLCGCIRRWSMSTYTSILTRLEGLNFNIINFYWSVIHIQRTIQIICVQPSEFSENKAFK